MTYSRIWSFHTLMHRSGSVKDHLSMVRARSGPSAHLTPPICSAVDPILMSQYDILSAWRACKFWKDGTRLQALRGVAGKECSGEWLAIASDPYYTAMEYNTSSIGAWAIAEISNTTRKHVLSHMVNVKRTSAYISCPTPGHPEHGHIGIEREPRWR